MSSLRVSDEEWEEWLEFLKKYNQQKEDRKQKVRESFLYGLYKLVTGKRLEELDDGK